MAFTHLEHTNPTATARDLHHRRLAPGDCHQFCSSRNGKRHRLSLSVRSAALCIAILILIITAISGCGLKRNNPLDPNANPTIIVPEIISNLQVFPSAPGAASKFVDLTWQANPSYSTDGYYVYRGLGFYSAFAVVDTVFTNRASHGSKPWHTVVPGEYYYKISAFKQYPSGRLEGRPCLPVWVRVPI